MGIEAFCPNGHRIKVKDSLAGMKGKCPTCGAPFRIPRTAGEAPAGTDLPAAHLLDVAPDVLATLPRVLPFTAAEPLPAPVFAAPQSPAPQSPISPSPVFENPPVAAPPAPTALHPVLADQPGLLWCIAFPGGEPTEPLPADSMQAWLDSGQAEGSEVVWRSDWPEWRPAREVFPDVIG